MRILLLTQWYPPEPALFIQELAQDLLSRGHEVTVLTGFPNYPAGKLYPGYQLHLWQREILGGVPIIRVPLYLDHSLSRIKRVLNYVSFALSSSALGFWLAPRPDFIFAYHPPLTIGLPAWILSRLWGIRFVYQIQDMWPETLRATGMLKTRCPLLLVESFARWTYSKAHSILVISPGFKKNLIDKGVPPEKVYVVSNWVEGGIPQCTAKDELLAQSLGLANRFSVIYAGNMGEAQGLETVLEAAELLNDLPQVLFVLIGDGIALPRLKKLLISKGLTNVRFIGRHSPDAMQGIYALADVLLVHIKDDPLFRITIPHKILVYLGTGKPILAAIAGDAADVIRSAGAGIVCLPGNPQALASAVRSFVAMSPDERNTFGECGIHMASTRYSRATLVTEIEKVLLQVSEL